MGAFSVPVQVGDLAGKRFITIEAVVDTGATHSVLPGELLERLGIGERGRRRFELGDDRIVEYPIGYALIRVNGDESIAPVVFGPEGTAPLLGATTLEILGLAADPVHRRLVPVPSLL